VTCVIVEGRGGEVIGERGGGTKGGGGKLGYGGDIIGEIEGV